MSKCGIAKRLAAEYGFKVFPIRAGEKFPPLIKDWPKNATNDPAAIDTWWTQWPDANIGIHCEGLLVIDVDVKNGGLEAFELLSGKMALPETLVNQTPTGGKHIIYRLPEDHPGVKNSVQVLGSGLDVRSTNGYIVGPGSTVSAGKYTRAAHVEIAYAPAELVQQCGLFTYRERGSEVNIPDAPSNIYRQARDWLADQEPAIEGNGGDAQTFKVCAGLHDYGVSVDQAMELIDEWNSRCSPPWAYRELKQKVINAYKYSQTVAGNRVALPSEFELEEEESEAKERLVETPLRVRSIAELSDAPTVTKPYIVKNFLLRGSFAQGFGSPGVGKSFVFMDLAYCVAAGRDWLGLPTKQGPVVYLSFEGSSGFATRGRALVLRYGDKSVPFWQIDASGLDLRQKSDRAKLIQTVAALPQKPVLIIVDTFARAMQGGDENSAQDVGQYLAAVAGFVDKGITVLQIHHPGKDSSKGARGSSALYGALDTEVKLYNRALHVTKQRELELLPPIGYKLTTVTVGHDPVEGEPITSCIVEVEDYVPAEPGPKPTGAAGKSREMVDILTSLDPSNKGYSKKAWVDECVESGMKHKTILTNIRRMVENGTLEVVGTKVKRVMEEDDADI